METPGLPACYPLRRNSANKCPWHVWGVLAAYGPHWVCPSSRSLCFPRPHSSGSRLLCRGTVQSRPWVSCTSQVHAAQVHVLGYSTKAQTRLDLRFVPFPGLSSSGNEVLGEHTVPGGPCILITSPVPATQFPGCAERAVSDVLCISSGELISGYDPTGRCQSSRILGRRG